MEFLEDPIVITILIVLGLGVLGVVGFLFMKKGNSGGKLKSRLNTGADGKPETPRMKEFISNIGQAASRPFMPKDSEKQYAIRKKLAQAGMYSPSAIRMIAGAKVICLGGGLVLGYLAGAIVDNPFLVMPIGGLIGYVAPMFWLKMQTGKNQLALTNALADALDLMVVCIEAGLTVDSAMQRVGEELQLAHPSLSRELGLTHMETRVGLSRVEALRNLGQRTGNASLQSLASMLIQADRFGTSIAEALRVHSETLRINRQMQAEEIAGKAAVKMSFPLVLCIFPATFIILAGPIVIQLMESPMFK